MSKTAKNEDVYNNYNSTRLGEDNEGRKKTMFMCRNYGSSLWT